MSQFKKKFFPKGLQYANGSIYRIEVAYQIAVLMILKAMASSDSFIDSKKNSNQASPY